MGSELTVHGERKTENEEKKRSETWSPLAFFPRKYQFRPRPALNAWNRLSNITD